MGGESAMAVIVHFRPIGVIHSPFQKLEDIAPPPNPGSSAAGTVEIFPEFAAGLQDLEGFSHIILLYYLHHATTPCLTVIPPRDTVPHGVFATRAPCRPNPIGLGVTRLARREGNILYVDRVDALDGTPLLDIKPYLPEFEGPVTVRTGWLQSGSQK
jgi:tRNA-Thr(GGU) m(6)t(6)A37 methyltransferase TsaA